MSIEVRGVTKRFGEFVAVEWDEAELRRLSQVMMDASICGLGQAAPNPVLTALAGLRERLQAEGIRFVGEEVAR